MRTRQRGDVTAVGPFGAPAGAIPTLAFAVTGAARLEHAAIPTLRFTLRVDAGGAQVRSVMLDTQVRIAATRRAYPHSADDRLFTDRSRQKPYVPSLLATPKSAAARLPPIATTTRMARERLSPWSLAL